jgi:hypothetical protein
MRPLHRHPSAAGDSNYPPRCHNVRRGVVAAAEQVTATLRFAVAGVKRKPLERIASNCSRDNTCCVQGTSARNPLCRLALQAGRRRHFAAVSNAASSALVLPAPIASRAGTTSWLLSRGAGFGCGDQRWPRYAGARPERERFGRSTTHNARLTGSLAQQEWSCDLPGGR